MPSRVWLCNLRLPHARLPSPSVSPRVCSNSCPLNWWCHLIISFSSTPFSSCPQSFPVSKSFPVSQVFPSGGQSTGASASVLQVNIQDWFPLGLTGLIFLHPRDSQESSPAPQFESINSLALSLVSNCGNGITNFSALSLLWTSQVAQW